MRAFHLLLAGCFVLFAAAAAVQASDLVNAVSNHGAFGDWEQNLESAEYPAGSDKFYLWEGRFWAGAVVNGEHLVSHADYMDYEWEPENDDPVTYEIIGGDQLVSEFTFDDLTPGGSHTPIGFIVDQTVTSYEGDDPLRAHLVEVDVQNVSGALLDSVYFAWVFDFDVAAGSGGDPVDPNVDDWTGWEEERWLAYMYDGDNPDEPGDDEGDDGLSPGYVGVAWLDGPGEPAAFQWWDWYEDPADDDEKFQRMAGYHPDAGGQAFMDPPTEVYDYRVLLSVGPYLMDEQQTLSVAVALAIGDGMAGLEEAVDEIAAHYAPGPVTLTLAPQNTVIPPGGGTLLFDVALVSTLPNTIPGVAFWTSVVTPGGDEYSPLMLIPFTHTPFMDVTVIGISQFVPAWAPGGTYTYTGHVGFHPLSLIDDSFTFEKAGAGDPGHPFDPGEWTATGEWPSAGAAGDATAVVATNAQLGDPAPNPFNPATTFDVQLPAAGPLAVTVYNVRGQVVAVLADGPVSAGRHSYTFDASNLASGLYFVRATAPGVLDDVRKLMLVR
ncbi:MAG: hypothetical protein MAG453_00897 [Calditrichaeota bacterium]|nr:hypothetical protein [Calditrichota bacterium]